MTDQPEALRLADALVRPDDSLRLADGNYLMPQAAAELRRLHVVNQELLAALKMLLNNNESLVGERTALLVVAKAEGKDEKA